MTKSVSGSWRAGAGQALAAVSAGCACRRPDCAQAAGGTAACGPCARAAHGPAGGGGACAGRLAVHAVLSGSAMTALFQGIGAFLLYAGAAQAPEQGVAEGVLTVDAQALLREVGEICQAADVCVSDLALIETESGPGMPFGHGG